MPVGDALRLNPTSTASAGMWLLALDTATDQAGIALFDGESSLDHSWPGSRRQSTTILPQVEVALAQLGLSLAAIGAVAVSIGPGSFTGLRVGLSIAKGFAIDGERVVIGVPTLEAAAHRYVEVGIDVQVMIPAGRGRIAWQRINGDAESLGAANATLEEFLDTADRAVPIVGELTPDHRRLLHDAGFRLASPLHASRVSSVAQIGWDRWHAGDVDDPVLLEPLYLHGRPNPR